MWRGVFRVLVVVLAPALRPPEAAAQEISSPASPEGSKTVVRAVREGDVYVGFDGFAAEPSSGKESLSATVRLSSRRLITARRCAVDGGALLFSGPVSYTHLRAHETVLDLVCRLLLEKKKNNKVGCIGIGTH
mgnify:CR=1 FL=1